MRWNVIGLQNFAILSDIVPSDATKLSYHTCLISCWPVPFPSHLRPLNPGKASSHTLGWRYVCWTLSYCKGPLQCYVRVVFSFLWAILGVMRVAGRAVLKENSPSHVNSGQACTALIRQRLSCQRVAQLSHPGSHVKPSASPQWEKNTPYGD